MSSDRSDAIARHILNALRNGGMSGGEVVAACRTFCSPSEVTPVLGRLVKLLAVSYCDGHYYVTPSGKSMQLPSEKAMASRFSLW